MRDFEQDRRICEAATPGEWRIGKYGQCVIADSEYGTHTDKGAAEYYGGNLVCESTYPQNATFIAAAREGWSAALDEIESLKRQLQVAAENVTNKTALCPHWAPGPGNYETKFCVGCNRPKELTISCWHDYWRQCAERVSSKDNGGNSNDKVTNSKDKEASK